MYREMLLKVASKNIALTPEGESELRRESQGLGALRGGLVGGTIGMNLGALIGGTGRMGRVGDYGHLIGLGVGGAAGGLLGRKYLGKALERKKRMDLISAYAYGDNPPRLFARYMTPGEARRAVTRYNILGKRRAMRREGKSWDEIDRETLKVASAYGFTPEELDYIIQEGLEEIVKL